MTTMTKHPIIEVLRLYNACILLSIITAQALFSLSIPIASPSIPALSILLSLAVLVLHLSGTYSYYRAQKLIGDIPAWTVLMYLLCPLGNLYCIITLSKRINTTLSSLECQLQGNVSNGLRNVGIPGVIGFADIRAIEKMLVNVK